MNERRESASLPWAAKWPNLVSSAARQGGFRPQAPIDPMIPLARMRSSVQVEISGLSHPATALAFEKRQVGKLLSRLA